MAIVALKTLTCFMLFLFPTILEMSGKLDGYYALVKCSAMAIVALTTLTWIYVLPLSYNFRRPMLRRYVAILVEFLSNSVDVARKFQPTWRLRRWPYVVPFSNNFRAMSEDLNYLAWRYTVLLDGSLSLFLDAQRLEHSENYLSNSVRRQY